MLRRISFGITCSKSISRQRERPKSRVYSGVSSENAPSYRIICITTQIKSVNINKPGSAKEVINLAGQRACCIHSTRVSSQNPQLRRDKYLLRITFGEIDASLRRNPEATVDCRKRQHRTCYSSSNSLLRLNADGRGGTRKS
jgi:hypothetical protein